MKTSLQIKEEYQQQIQILKAETLDLKKKVDQYSFLRLAVFALTIFLIYLFFDAGFSAVIPISILAIIAFLYLVKVQVKQKNLLDFKKFKNQIIKK